MKSYPFKIATTISLVIGFLLLMPVFAFSEEASAQFQQANNLYQSGKFDEAAQLYEQIISKDSLHQSSQLRFNLANAQFRMGRINDAIYNYERALALNPWYGDARANLNVARSKIEYKIEDKRNLFIRFYDLVLKWVPNQFLALVTLVFSLLFLVSAWLWFRNINRQQFWVFPRSEFFVIFLLVVVLWGAEVFYKTHYREAIVLAPEAEVRYGPSMDNQSLMKLGGGLKVFIVDTREDWSRVLTWNGETGWMKNSQLGRIQS